MKLIFSTISAVLFIAFVNCNTLNNSNENLLGDTPATVDWREKGAVTAVQDQGRCKSDYAFSVLGAIESHYFIHARHSIVLSEQQVIDCSNAEGNLGCSSGTTDATYKYIMKAGGLNSFLVYPYKADVSGTCGFSDTSITAKITSFVTLPSGNEQQLQNAVAHIGPVSATITVVDSFNQYTTGVYDEPNCAGTNKQDVLIVGYGTEGGKDYWLVKNSKGLSFGDKGYIKMSRNKNNQCGIASHATYPTQLK